MKERIVGALLAVAALALLAGMGFVAGRASMLREYGELAGQVEQQNQQAERKLAELTAQRDIKQAALNKAAADQERKDADAKAEIERLAGELRDRPVRVRVVAQAGDCSRGAAGDAAARAEDRAGDTGTAYGILPPENTRRLGAALTEIETLSAAYSSCRAMLTGQGIAN